MILEPETYLLQAVRTRLIEGLGLLDDDIDIEVDDMAPAMAGNTYYCLSPESSGPGRFTATADKTIHGVFGVRVAVLERIGNVPRDRRRTVFIDQLKSINRKLSKVAELLRFDYATIASANANMVQDEVNGQFHKPLAPRSVDAKPRMMTSDLFGAASKTSSGDPLVVMVRGMGFGGAEFLGKTA